MKNLLSLMGKCEFGYKVTNGRSANQISAEKMNCILLNKGSGKATNRQCIKFVGKTIEDAAYY